MWPKLLDPRPYFADLPDPRRETRNKLHKLHDILMIVLCAVLSGVEDWVGMEAFAEEKERWLRGFLELPNGIPAHDTLSDVLGRMIRSRSEPRSPRGPRRRYRISPASGRAWMARPCAAVGMARIRRCIGSVPLPGRLVG